MGAQAVHSMVHTTLTKARFYIKQLEHTRVRRKIPSEIDNRQQNIKTDVCLHD